MPKPWKFTSLRGSSGLSDDSEDPRGDPPEPEPEDTSAEDRAVEAEPDYFAEAVKAARIAASQVTDQQKRAELLACLDEAERVRR